MSSWYSASIGTAFKYNLQLNVLFWYSKLLYSKLSSGLELSQNTFNIYSSSILSILFPINDKSLGISVPSNVYTLAVSGLSISISKL